MYLSWLFCCKSINKVNIDNEANNNDKRIKEINKIFSKVTDIIPLKKEEMLLVAQMNDNDKMIIIKIYNDYSDILRRQIEELYTKYM
jgi:hypothetical protein